MAWPEEPEDSVNYSERELISSKDLALRMVDNSRLDFWGTFYINGTPFQNIGGRIDVRSFGVKGDGSDEADALQAAIDSGYAILVPRGVKVCVGKTIWLKDNMDLMIDGRIEKIWTPVGQSGGASAMFRGGVMDKYGTRLKNVKISGTGSVGTPNHTIGNGYVWYIGGDDTVIKDITVDTYWGGAGFGLNGHRIRLINVKVINSPLAAGTGAVRFVGGNDFMAIGCHLESGDDVLQFTPSESVQCLDINRGAYIGCTGFSTLGRFMVVINAGPSESVIQDVAFIGCHGKASNRAVNVSVLENAKGSIRRVSFINCSVDNSSAGQGVADGAFFIQNTSSEKVNGTELRDVLFDNVTLINPWSAPIAATSVNNLTFKNCYFDNDRNMAQTNPPIIISDCDNFRFTNNQSYVSKPSLYTMQFNGLCDRIIIENNDFRNIQEAAGCLNFYESSNVTVRGNTFYTAPGTISIANCIRFQSNNTVNHLVENNDFSKISVFSDVPVSQSFTSRVKVRNNYGIANPYVTAVANYVMIPATVCYGLVQMTGAGAKTFQLQDDTKGALPLSAWVDILNSGAADITVMAQAGATLTLTGTLVVHQNQIARITKIGPSTYHSVVWT